MAEQQKILKKWIDLKDPYGAQLKLGRYNNKLVLVITGVRPRSQNFQKVVNDLGFIASGTGAYLVKAVEITDRILPSMFHGIWPRARLEMMDPTSYTLDLSSVKQRLEERARQRNNAKSAEEIDAERKALQESVSNILARSEYLGRNAEGLRVFGGVTGRFTVDDSDTITYEDPSKPSTTYLRTNTQSDIRECAKGLLRAAEKGESQNLSKLLGFAGTVLQKDASVISMDEREMIAQAIDSAILESLVENNETAGKAWADAAYYQEMIPGRTELAPDSLTTPYLPAPIAVQVQRFLTSANAVNVNGKIPGFGFGMLPDSTRVFVEDPDTLEWGSQTFHRPIVEHAVEQDIPAEGGYWRISGSPSSEDFEGFFSSLTNDATAVITAGDLAQIDELQKHARLLQSIKVPTWLSGTPKPIYILVMRKDEDQDGDLESHREAAPITSWDDLKTVVDETLLLMGKEDAANEKINLKSERTDNQLQRPYLSASKVGEASTMVPRNLQSALGFALSRLEENNGQIDEFVAAELGIGRETMGERLSPEQVDAIALAIDRVYSGRGFILGDETGIGKGRTIASMAAWAARQGKRIVFVTDRANLFSDLGRDLIDINEWERFRPLITNTDGKILDIMGNGEEIAQPLTPAQLRRAMQMDPADLPENIIFTTYSQLSGEGSEKAKWLQELSHDSMLILDEAHIAAGSDSNTAKNVQSMVDGAWGVLYSSATWAKSSKNLHIYSRALPESVNITQVITAMKSEGESFGEVFSSMLAMDGALIRREHDLSKVDFVVDVDNKYTERNQQIAGQVSEILGMMAMVSGEINHMLQRMSSETRNALTEARKARAEITSAANSEALSLENQRSTLQNSLLGLKSNKEALIRELSQLQEVPEDEVDVTQAPNLRDRDLLDATISHMTEAGPLSPEQRTELDIAVAERSLANVMESISRTEQALAQLPAPASSAARIGPSKLFSSSFGTGGAIYQVMRRTIAALSVDYTADRAIESAREGRRPVIVLEETGESFVRQLINDEIARIQEEIRSMREREAKGELTDADRTTREIAEMLDTGVRPSEVVRQVRAPNLQDMLRQLVARLGGIRITETNPSIDETDKGVITTTAYTNLTDLPDVSPEVVQKYMDGVQQLTEKINALPMLPLIPFDALRIKMEAAGLRVSEISGRHHSLSPVNTVVPSEESGIIELTGPLELKKRARKKSDVTQTASQFNSGEYDVLLINQSAATGISLHASPRFADTRQRDLFEMQSPENPTTRIQLFGRVNRFDQVIPPKITIMNTGLKSEMRAMIMANQKLKKLSANVRASQENAALIEDVPDLLNRTGDKVCQEFLLENPGIASRLDIQMDKIKDGYGLANVVTQRLALLGLDEYERVYNGLCEAYDDAVLADKLAMSGDSIATYDWKARMLSQRHAWGPTQHIDSLSAFDSPVLERIVEYVENYQPYHWQDIRDRIAEATQRLIEDERVKPQHILSIAPPYSGQPVFDSVIRLEENLTDAEKHNYWSSQLMNSLVMALPAEALENAGHDLEESARPIERLDEEDAEQMELGLLDTPALTHVPKGFEAIANHWVATEARIPGTRVTQRMMTLISRSGKSAKSWFLNEKGEARQFLINLDKAIKGDHNQMGNAIKELEKITGLTEESWQRQRFNKVWGSIDPEVHLLDITEATKKASRMLEAKKIMGLQQTGMPSIEAALSDREHNAVKEAHFRSLFFENVVSRLVPGVEILIRDKEKKSIVDFFGDSRMVIMDVKVPASPHEASLSKWKFHIAMPGHQEPVVMSGAVIFKMAGFAPKFQNLHIGHNLFEGIGYDMEVAARSFNRYKKGERTMRKTLLVGNMFQAGEWARASKRGRSILYTDESGQTHRAVEVLNTGPFQSMVDFPLRLHNKDTIKDFVTEIMGPGNTDPTAQTVNVYTSFRGALAAQQSSATTTSSLDLMIFDKRTNAIGWYIDKGEKEKVRRALRSAVKADQKRWEQENPDTPYPVKFSTHAPRGTSNQLTQLTIKLPDTPIGRDRFIDILAKSQGLEIFALRSNAVAYSAATKAERNHYERLAQPALAEKERKRAIMERRSSVQKMLGTAFGDRQSKEKQESDTVKAPEVKGEVQGPEPAQASPSQPNDPVEAQEASSAEHEGEVITNDHSSPSVR